METTLNILLVEDNESLRRAYGDVITEVLGHNVREAATVDEARRCIEEGERVDIVISDTQLYDNETGIMHLGWELMAFYRARNIPCVGISLDDVAEEWMKHGAVAFMRKPLDLDKLNATMTAATRT